MTFQEVEQAVADAKSTLYQADRVTAKMARLLQGKMRLVSNEWDGGAILAELKRELRGFNCQTKKWK